MGTSSYQLFKLHFLSIVPLAKDAVHIYVGVLALLVATALLRLPVRSYRALLPGLAWQAGKWPGTVAMVIAMQTVMMLILWLAWSKDRR